MEMNHLDTVDRTLLAAMEDGLPLVSRPYRAIGEMIGLDERKVTARIRELTQAGIIRRFGVIVRHHEIGYRSNAMAVWDVPDGEVGDAGRRLAELPYVSLSYRRPRRPPQWPYNLFCMIHGRERAEVEDLVARAAEAAELTHLTGAVLFSGRRFKQRGARYSAPVPGAA